jgi:hypothetical protein
MHETPCQCVEGVLLFMPIACCADERGSGLPGSGLRPFHHSVTRRLTRLSVPRRAGAAGFRLVWTSSLPGRLAAASGRIAFVILTRCAGNGSPPVALEPASRRRPDLELQVGERLQLGSLKWGMAPSGGRHTPESKPRLVVLVFFPNGQTGHNLWSSGVFCGSCRRCCQEGGRNEDTGHERRDLHQFILPFAHVPGAEVDRPDGRYSVDWQTALIPPQLEVPMELTIRGPKSRAVISGPGSRPRSRSETDGGVRFRI